MISKAISFILRVTNKLFLIFIEFLSLHFRGWKAIDFHNVTGKKLLVIRHGGIGDLLFITPILRELKTRYPQLKVTLMAKVMYHSLFYNYPFIDSLINHAWPNLFKLFSHDYILFFDKSIEVDKDAEEVNVYDLFSEKYTGITMEALKKKPVIFYNEDNLNYMQSKFPFLDDGKLLNIGVQIKAGSPVRTPSPEFWQKVIARLLKGNRQYRVFLIDEGHFNHAERIRESVLAAIPDAPLYSFAPFSRNIQDLIAIVRAMDLIIAPDSSVIHISAGMDVPSIGIYGPFPSKLRTRYYPKTIAIDAPADCVPCFTHGHKPCKRAGEQARHYSPCFEDINPDIIAESVSSMGNKYKNLNESNRYAYKNLQMSETSKFRSKILQIVNEIAETDFNTLSGLEIGCAGDPLIDESMCLDMEVPYTKCGNKPIHLKGDARKLRWFSDNSLDYIYSSHVFEDFPEPENAEILKEWSRVLKHGGIMVLLLPHQQRYAQYCASNGEMPNEHHRILHFDPIYMKNLLENNKMLRVIGTHEFWLENQEEYNFLIIAQKEYAV